MTGTASAGLVVAAASITAAALVSTTVLTARLLRQRLYLATVRGLSMAPTLMPGDRLLVARPRRRPTKAGDIVIAPAPRAVAWAGQPTLRPTVDRTGWVVKRVAAVGGERVPERLRCFSGMREWETVPEGTVVLLGDGKHSEDSRHWGFCPHHLILGRVLLRMARGPGHVPDGRSRAGRPPTPMLPVPVPAQENNHPDRR
ncbi:S26 family signal peptidase [Kitasatospora sp. NPDC085879]|uniref:S26 family signal peptidase n=1 Tax=Kitasatospora sp. NPDC085879 TaxID=3154769 RepID=UPI0034265537